MGHVHPIKPCQRPVVFPLRRKRTVHLAMPAAANPMGMRPAITTPPRLSRPGGPDLSQQPSGAGRGERSAGCQLGEGTRSAGRPDHGENKANRRWERDRHIAAVKESVTPDVKPGRAGRPVPRPGQLEGEGQVPGTR
jgi:hypothetical protein